MKKAAKINLLFAALIISGSMGFSQVNGQKADSLRLQEQVRTTSEIRNQNREGNANGQSNRNNAPQSPKQIRGGRPDMSKARGARPPVIVRPSGSGIPKGAGKPGGVGRKGGR